MSLYAECTSLTTRAFSKQSVFGWTASLVLEKFPLLGLIFTRLRALQRFLSKASVPQAAPL